MHRKFVGFIIGFIFLIGIFLSLAFGYYLISPANKGGDDQLFNVKEGTTLRWVAEQLAKKRIITSKNGFLIWAKIMGYGRDIKAGEYRLNPSMPPLKIMKILKEGVIITYPVTIPEGFSMKQIAELLEKKGLANRNEFLSLTTDENFIKRNGLSGSTLEGYLYPDTYHFGRNLSAVSIIHTMINRYKEVVLPFQTRVKQMGMRMNEVITLASIVEKETGKASERPIIASVFLNRLKKKMRLESDPTVIYGLKEFSGNIKKRHLTEPTPYNTYVIRGLPPGPIANPGKASIEAVLYPADTEFLYFVSKNDGSHYFSKTLKEHNQAVEKYQKKKRKRRRKAS